MSWLSDAWDGATGWTKSLDPTSSTSWAGRALGGRGVELAREIVGSSAFVVTGGASHFFRPDLTGPAFRGFATGATFGANVGRGLVGAGMAGASQVEANYQSTVPTGTGAFQQPQGGAQIPTLDLGKMLRNPIVLVVLAILALLVLSPGRATVIREKG